MTRSGRGERLRVPDRIRPVLNPSRAPFLKTTTTTQQDMWRGMGEAWTALSTIIAGIAVWGAIGFGIDRLFGTWPGFFAGGVILGNFLAIYLVYMRSLAVEAERR
jgi:F0F1-type ATP synthase assembly protein I